MVDNKKQKRQTATIRTTPLSNLKIINIEIKQKMVE